MSKFDFLPTSEQEKKMNDPFVKQAIRTLKSRGITIQQIEEVYKYYDRIQIGHKPKEVISWILE